MTLASIKKTLKVAMAFILLSSVTIEINANPVSQELLAFFAGKKEWCRVVDQVVCELRTNIAHWTTVLGDQAQVHAIIAALQSVRMPGAGIPGLQKIKATLYAYEPLIQRAVPDVWAKVKKTSDARILMTCGHLVR